MTDVERPAIVLLSGGLDSTTCLAIAAAEHYRPIFTMAFDYGQRHRAELRAAEQISRSYTAKEHRVVKIDLRQFGGSALTAEIAVPKDQLATHAFEPNDEENLPVTYVPARNTIFLSYALAWCEVLNCDHVFIGVNALDFSGYPDCRPEFIEAFQTTARLGTTRKSFTVHTPLITLTKAQIIRRGVQLGVDYSATHSCYDPDETGRACGHCDSCLLRARGFAQAGAVDPTHYASAGDD